MEKKLPVDAYEYYMSLGHGRSYQAVAEHFGVSKQTVTKRAVKEKWQDRIAQVERRSRERAEAKYADTLDEMNDRHLKMFMAIQGKGIEALRAVPITTAMQAVRAIDMAVRNERLIREQPTERTEVSIERILREEWDKWMLKPGEVEDWSDLEGDAGTAALVTD